MKKFFFLIIIFIIGHSIVNASERDEKLNALFYELKKSKSEQAYQTEKKIWKIWSTHPRNDDLTYLLSQGSDFVDNFDYNKAVDIFTEVINLDPTWAEAWNKRATVLYLMGEFQKSQKDIDKVLQLEKRHFGALAGQGLVNIQLENYEKAIKSYEKAKEIYPSMKSPEIMIEQIKDLIKKELI
tara:strand:- start:1298 stop:1846 length:549 start_codon:yes stop_codon:yes gene_type:complete